MIRSAVGAMSNSRRCASIVASENLPSFQIAFRCSHCFTSVAGLAPSFPALGAEALFVQVPQPQAPGILRDVGVNRCLRVLGCRKLRQ